MLKFGDIYSVNNGNVFICHVTDGEKDYALRFTSIQVFQIFKDGEKLLEYNCQQFPFKKESIEKIYLHLKEQNLLPKS